MKQGETCTIEVVDSATGRPLEPRKNATKFVNQCGAIVRDNVSITVQEWNKPKKARIAGFTFVDKRTKKDCFKKLMEHFVLPPEYNKFDEEGNKIEENKERRRLVKQFALHKMADAFRKFKQNLAHDFVKQNKTPDFKGQYEKLKDDWPEFVKQKKSEQFIQISKKIRKMRLRRSTIILWGQEGIAFGSLGGRRWRTS